MNVKFLIGILNRPWLIEPLQAEAWADAAQRFLFQGHEFTAPITDKRRYYTSSSDYGAAFRVNADGSVNSEGPIQVLRIDGPVAKQDYCGSPGSITLTQMLAAANADPAISGILLYIDSPGGQVDGTENFANAVAASAKPVVSFSDGMICSAAYWYASGAREIIVDGSNDGWNATIGSIGTMAAWEDDTEKKLKEGVRRIQVFADASSEKWGDYFARMKGDYTRLKQELNGINATFLAAVRKNRAGVLDSKENVLTGKTYNAKEALKNGLIDKIGTFTDAVARVVALGKSNRKSTNMSKSTNVFQNTLTAAKATEFQVVEGGFLLTEDHLNNIDAAIDSQNTIVTATASQLKVLQGKEAQFAANEKAAADLLKAQSDLEAANASITKLQTTINEQNEKLAEYAKQPGGFFQTSKATKADDPGDEVDEDEAVGNLPHNKKADALYR